MLRTNEGLSEAATRAVARAGRLAAASARAVAAACRRGELEEVEARANRAAVSLRNQNDQACKDLMRSVLERAGVREVSSEVWNSTVTPLATHRDGPLLLVVSACREAADPSSFDELLDGAILSVIDLDAVPAGGEA